MKRFMLSVFLMVAILPSGVLFSQEIGLGGSMHIEQIYLFDYELIYLNLGMTPTIRIPIILSDKFSIEPEIGIWHYMDKYKIIQ